MQYVCVMTKFKVNYKILKTHLNNAQQLCVRLNSIWASKKDYGTRTKKIVADVSLYLSFELKYTNLLW